VGVLNRTVSDSRLSVTPIAGYPDAFKLTRLVDGDDAPLELAGTTVCLVLRQVITDWNLTPRTEDWGDVLEQSAVGFGG
jgi:hypothetical protein